MGVGGCGDVGEGVPVSVHCVCLHVLPVSQ